MNEQFMMPKMTTDPRPQRQFMRLILGMLFLLSGLCTIFALVVTVAEAWQEHNQERWPEVTASVERCGLQRTSSRRRQSFYIHCRLSYAVGAERNVAHLYSTNVPSPEVWQYPPNQIGPFEEWVAEHPPGTPIVVRYNPANHTKVVMMANYMPRGGPRTLSNIKLLAFWAVSFLVLLTILRITRSQSQPIRAAALIASAATASNSLGIKPSQCSTTTINARRFPVSRQAHPKPSRWP